MSNKEDCLAVIEFLQTVGERNTKWFMSDDAEQFSTAWRVIRRHESVLGILTVLGGMHFMIM